MTKRDVAVWFCRVWALAGILGAAFTFATILLNWLGLFGMRGGPAGFGMAYMSISLPHLVLSIFLCGFAASIGTELAAEGEFGSPIASVVELKPLLLRCAGLSLLFSATASLTPILLQLGYYHFSPSGLPASITQFYVASAVSYGLQSLIGFLLAFTPRIRAFFRY